MRDAPCSPAPHLEVRGPLSLPAGTHELAALSGVSMPRCEGDELCAHDWQEVDWQEGEWHPARWDQGWTPTQDLDWVASCAEAFAEESELRIAILGGPSGVRAVAPLVQSGRLGVEHQLGVAELFEPSDFLYRDLTSLHDLASALAAEGRCLRLRRVPADSPTLAAIAHAYRGHGIISYRAAPPCPVVYLDEQVDGAAIQRSKRLDGDLRRAWRRAGELGRVELEVHEPVRSADVTASFKEALDIEAASWKGDAHTALRDDPRRRRFFERYCARAAARGRLRISFLRIDGHAVAMQIGVQSGRRMWVLKVGYRASHARCSPGLLLMQDVLRRAAADGLETVELLGTTAGWTDRFTPHRRETVEVRAFPRSPRGLAVRGAEAWSARSSALLQRLRGSST